MRPARGPDRHVYRWKVLCVALEHICIFRLALEIIFFKIIMTTDTLTNLLKYPDEKRGGPVLSHIPGEGAGSQQRTPTRRPAVTCTRPCVRLCGSVFERTQ